LTELQFLKHLLVAPELARAVNLDFGLALEFRIGAFREILGRLREQRPRFADVTEPELEALRPGRRGKCHTECGRQKGGTEKGLHFILPSVCIRCKPQGRWPGSLMCPARLAASAFHLS